MKEELLDPSGKSSPDKDVWKNYIRRLAKVENLHRTVDLYHHPRTYAHYIAYPSQHSWSFIRWRYWGPKEATLAPVPMQDDLRGEITLPLAGQTPSQRPGKLEIESPSAPGDGTGVLCDNAPIAEIIFIPETEEFVVLSIHEMKLFIKYESQLDQLILDIMKAKTPEAGIAAKEAFAQWVDDEFKQNKHLEPVMDSKADIEKFRFVEVYTMTGNKFSLLPRNLIHRFRRDTKTYGLGNPQRRGTPAGTFKKNALFEKKTATKAQHKFEKLVNKAQWAKVTGTIKHDWELWEAKKEGQLPVRYALQAMGTTGRAITTLLGDEGLAHVDQFIENFNANGKIQLRDETERKKKLLYYIDPEQAQKAQMDKTLAPDEIQKRGLAAALWLKVFDDAMLGYIQREVEYIWGQAPEDHFKNFVDKIKKIDFRSFAANEATLVKERQKLYQEVGALEIPDYRFDCSVEAQLLRYSCGSTGAISLDLKNMRLAVKTDNHADIALAQAKASLMFYLPNDKGGELSIPQKVQQWKLAEHINLESLLKGKTLTSKPTFDFDKTFILPAESLALRTFVDLKQLNDLISLGYSLQITGHTDLTGKETYNELLGKERAQVAYEAVTYQTALWLKRFLPSTTERWRWGLKEFLVMLHAVTGNPEMEPARFQGLKMAHADLSRELAQKNLAHGVQIFVRNYAKGVSDHSRPSLTSNEKAELGLSKFYARATLLDASSEYDLFLFIA